MEWQILSRTVLIACDNISALKYSIDTKKYKFIHTGIPDYDIIQSSRNSFIPSVWYHYQHVKGHQDELDRPLEFLEILNVRMDELAKTQRIVEESLPYDDNIFYRLPHEIWSLSLNSTKVCRNVEQHIYGHISATTIRSYWSKPAENGGREFDDVDWKGIQGAINSLPKHQQHWISKHW